MSVQAVPEVAQLPVHLELRLQPQCHQLPNEPHDGVGHPSKRRRDVLWEQEERAHKEDHRNDRDDDPGRPTCGVACLWTKLAEAVHLVVIVRRVLHAHLAHGTAVALGAAASRLASEAAARVGGAFAGSHVGG